jgi:hypothetical protein
MFGKNPHLSPLELRKQLLLTESELNRAQLAEDISALKAGIHSLVHRATSFNTIASSAAMLMTALAAFRRNRPAPAKSSWWRTLLKGAGLVSTLWMTFRSQGARPGQDLIRR